MDVVLKEEHCCEIVETGPADIPPQCLIMDGARRNEETRSTTITMRLKYAEKGDEVPDLVHPSLSALWRLWYFKYVEAIKSSDQYLDTLKQHLFLFLARQIDLCLLVRGS
jgi:hypothetical protein